MMLPTAPALLRRVEQVLTGYADRVMTQEQARRGADVASAKDTRPKEFLLHRPRRVTHAELIAVANRFLDDLADAVAPPIGQTLKIEDERPAILPLVDEDDQ